jgi:hypothetical protein
VSVAVHFHGGPMDGTCREINADVPPPELCTSGLPPVTDLAPHHGDALLMPVTYVYWLSGRGSVHYLYRGER